MVSSKCVARAGGVPAVAAQCCCSRARAAAGGGKLRSSLMEVNF